MKSLVIAITALAFITTTAHAGLFGPSDQEINLQNQLAQQHNLTWFWIVVAGALALCVIIAFITGTILGSRTRKNAKQPDSSEPQ